MRVNILIFPFIDDWLHSCVMIAKQTNVCLGENWIHLDVCLKHGKEKKKKDSVVAVQCNIVSQKGRNCTTISVWWN